MNQSPQLAHLMNNYTSTNEQQVLQQYLANASTTFPHAHSLALHNMTTMNGSASSLLNNLNNFTAFGSLAAAMAAQSSNLTSSPLSSTNSSTVSNASTNLNQTNGPMFAALLQAHQQLNGLNSGLSTTGLNASSLLQKYEQVNNNSQQSPSSASNCSSPPTCSSVTPPTPPPNTTSATSLQLLAQHYQLQQSTTVNSSSISSTVTLSNSLSNGQSVINTTNSNIPTSLSVAAAAVLNGQPNLSSLVAANSQLSLDSLIAANNKRITASPDNDASNELADIQQQYYNQLNALRQQLLLSSAGLSVPFNPTNIVNSTNLTKQSTNQQPAIKDLARLYSAINCNNMTELNSPISSSLSSSSSSTNSLQNTMTSLQQQQMMAAAMASTGTFSHNAHMHLLSPNSIKSLKFSIENILSPSFGNSPAEIAAAINQQNSTQNKTNLTNSLNNSSPMSKLLEFNKNSKNGLITSSSTTTNKLSKFLNNNNSSTTKLTKLEQVNSNINGLSSIINNLNPGLSVLDFKLNTSKRKKRSSSSMDDSCDKDIESFRNVKRKNSIDSDCSNSNSSIGPTKLNSINNSNDKQFNDKHTESVDSSKEESTRLPSLEEIKEGKEPVPAWVFCTRYSDRPSSGKFLFISSNFFVSSFFRQNGPF